MKALITKYFQPVALFILTVTVASFFSMLGVDPHHQGIMFKPAFDVAHGQMLFRDTFTQYGALTTLLQAWALRIFGDYLVVIQIQTAVFYGLISLCLYCLWLKILPQWLTTASVLIWLLLAPYFRTIMPFVPWSSVLSLFFQLFSLIIVLRALCKQSRPMMILAGSVAVLTFWCRQPVGVFHCASLVFFLSTTPLITGEKWKKAITDCAFFVAGMVAASLPFFVWLALNGALHDMYLQSIKGAFFFGTTTYQSESYNLFTNILMALLAYETKSSHFYTPWSTLPLACLCILAMLAVERWRNRGSVNSHLPLYGLLLVSMSSWMQYYPVPCLRHLYWAATPMIGVFSYGVWQICKLCVTEKERLCIIIVCLVLIFVYKSEIETSIFTGQIKIAIFKTKIEEPKVLRGMYATPLSAAKYKTISMSLNNAIVKNATPYLVNLSSDALYLTFIGPQHNFHPMYISWGEYNDFIYPDYQRIRDEFINTKRPIVLRKDGEDISGWSCVDVFDVIDQREQLYYYGYARKLALYQFTGNNYAH